LKKKLILVFVATLGALLSVSAAETNAPLKQIKIVLVGDSTVAIKSGWGPGFQQLLTDRVECTNTAAGGRSSRSFISEGRWQAALALKGDYYLIQFGHNDQPGKGPERETDPETSYREFMSRYVDEARAIGAKPVLVTSLVRRQWNQSGDGKITSTLEPYAAAVRKIAAEKNVPLVDLHAASKELCEQLGRERCNELSPLVSNRVDNTHLNAKGSAVFGRLVATKLVEAMPELAPYFRLDKSARTNSGWSDVPEILARITPPHFPAREIDIGKFGAVTNTDASLIIRRAITESAASGGGRVTIPAGEFFTGPIPLESNVELHLATNAVLKFVNDPARYLPAVFTRFEGTECYNLSPLIYALDKTNVAVTGDGTLDGQADGSNWLAWGKVSARKQLAQMAEKNVPVEKRQFGINDHLRPNFIQFVRCQNVLIEGVKIRRSPMWEIHPLLCSNVTVRGVEISSHGANNDGCDPESCRDVLIEKCTFDTGDDCIAIKSGRNADGRRVGVPSQDIVIRDCTMRDGHGGVTIGSEISGGCSNVFVENCEMDSPKLNCVLRLKSNAMRGGVLQNIFMRNVQVGLVKDSVLQIDFLYEEGANGSFNPVADNIVMENIYVAQTPRVLNVKGFPAAKISGVRIYNSSFKQVKKPDLVLNADVKLVNCQVTAGQ
jgi:polygalacturonase